jgi:hypothetical protein
MSAWPLRVQAISAPTAVRGSRWWVEVEQLVETLSHGNARGCDVVALLHELLEDV